MPNASAGEPAAPQQIEAAWRESEWRLTELYERVEAILYTRDEGEPVGFFSPSCERILGHPKDPPWTFDFFMSLIHPDERERVLLEYGSDDKPAWLTEYRIRHADGSYRWIRDRGSYAPGPDGRPGRIYGVITDITEQHQAHEQLARATRLESLGRLASGVAHDFGATMAGIILVADWIAANPGHPSVADEARMLSTAAEGGMGLTRALLTFAQGGSLAHEPTDAVALVHHTAGLLRHLIPASVRLEVTTEDGLLPVPVDRAGLSHALMNLAVNARDAMPNGGVLRIAASRTALDEGGSAAAGLTAGPYLALEVSDTGLGIAPSVLEHIFEPFFTTKEGSGTGLGLATVYGFARAHDGAVTVASELRRGTTFTLYLPTK